MTRGVVLTLILGSFALAGAAHALGLGLGSRMGHLGASAGAGTSTQLTNLRITNDGSIRIIGTGDNRAVSP